MAKISDCGALQLTLDILYCFTISSSSYLFLLRINAVFHDAPLVRLGFTFIWLTVVGGSMTIPFAAKGGNIVPTNYCINTEVKSYVSASAITSTVYDTLVFLAISLQLIANYNPGGTWREKLQIALKRDGVSNVAHALFHSGQIYYLCVHFDGGGVRLTLLFY